MEIERLGPYQIVDTLGRGGMGTVYKAVHSETGEQVAVKLLSPELAHEEGFRSRFEAEIETLRKLNHPNIVRLLAFGEQDEKLFYAMELVDGNSLEEELRRGRRFDWREVTRIGIETCRALRHAHDRGVIHRDIKPANVLLATDGRVKLSDFGIARLFGYSRLTNVGNVLGTAEYMAPEQAAGLPVDTRADLYSLGALMYALLARRPVFRGKSLPEMLHKQQFEQPEPIRKHVPDLPEEMERILSQLLEKEPARRIANADVLARRLEAILQAMSVNNETLAADASWFVLSEQPASSNLDEAASSPNDIPITLALSADRDCSEPSVEVTSSLEKHGKTVSDAIVTGTAPTPGRFVVVGEDELGGIEEEEDRPAMISWQTGALAAALLSVGLIVWWLLQPATADTLYNRIKATTADGSIASIRQAEGDICEFLNRYSNDRNAPELQALQKEIDLDNLQRQFDSPIKRLTNKEKLQPIERAYSEAMNYVRLDPEIGMTKLQAIVDLYEQPDVAAGSSDQCLILAQRRLAQLREEVKKRSAKQFSLLQERLDAADALRKSEPEQAKKMYRAVVQLYAEKPWAASAVSHARKALKILSQRQP